MATVTPAAEPAPSNENGSVQSITRKRIVVNTADPSLVKRMLDSEVIEFLYNDGFLEDQSISNIRIACGTVACLLALAGQFYFKPFPDMKLQLGFCVLGYFLFSGLMQLPLYLLEKDTLMLTKPKQGGAKRGLLVRTSMPRGSSAFAVTLAYRHPVHDKRALVESEVQRVVEVTEFFDVSGVFLQRDFHARVLQPMRKQLANKKAS